MEMNHNLPFEVGQQAEAKSFLKGYRGAWFRCQVKELGHKAGHPRLALEYYDFPDEKIRWTQLYHKSPADRQRYLMVRPSFPQIYHRSQMHDIHKISEVVTIVDGTWEVGDLVDWYKDGCYWSARITHIVDEDNVQVQLPEPPVGEGKTYEASCKDLRPSLEWTPECGWTVPISKEGKTSRRCAHLIQPKSQDKVRNDDFGTSEPSSSEFRSSSVSSHRLAGSLHTELSSGSSEREILEKPSRIEGKKRNSETTELSSHSSERGILKQHSVDTKEKIQTSHEKNDGEGKISFSDSVSSTHGNKCGPVSIRKDVASRDRYNSCGSSKKMKTCEAELNSTYSDTIESSILDLEELVNKVKWLKGALEYGFQLSNAMKPSWKFLETRSSFADQ